MFRTEYEFTLPMGYLDPDGGLHREGTIRLATAADEILPQKDPRVQKNPAYLIVILLSRVITKLEGVEAVTPRTIEGLFTADLNYLQNLYNEINRVEDHGQSVTCPQCGHAFDLEQPVVGGSQATPSISFTGR